MVNWLIGGWFLVGLLIGWLVRLLVDWFVD